VVNVWDSRFRVDVVDLVLFEPGRSRFLVFLEIPFFYSDFVQPRDYGGLTSDGLSFLFREVTPRLLERELSDGSILKLGVNRAT